MKAQLDPRAPRDNLVLQAMLALLVRKVRWEFLVFLEIRVSLVQ
jgi:hypothetical protein